MARSRTEGRELLRQLALRGQSWAGIEVTTLRPLALGIAADCMAAEGVRVVDEFEEQAMVEQAIDEVVRSRPKTTFDGLANRVGFRDAVRRSVSALRRAGVRPEAVRRASRTEKLVFLGSVLQRFESALQRRRLTDTAGVLRRACQALADNGWAPQANRSVFLLPGQEARGLPGRFLITLRRAGAIVLKTDPVECLAVPAAVRSVWDVAPHESPTSFLHAAGRQVPRRFGIDIDVFAAASVYDELRGVLRRILACGARWDEVEIITTNPALYGSALHALAVPMKVPVTFAAGLPVERTRPGRVVSGYFRWVESGYQESVIRALIEAEDIKPPKPHDWIDGPRLARALRRLRIGWGRSRYQAAIDHALGQLDLRTPERYKDDEQFVRRRNRDKQDLEALRELLLAVLEATPSARPSGPERSRPDRSPPAQRACWSASPRARTPTGPPGGSCDAGWTGSRRRFIARPTSIQPP